VIVLGLSCYKGEQVEQMNKENDLTHSNGNIGQMPSAILIDQENTELFECDNHPLLRLD